MAVWFAGSREWAKDVNLLTSIYDQNVGKWGPVQELVSDAGYSLGNAVMVHDTASGYHLWYVRTKGYWHDGEIVHMVWPNLDEGFILKEPAPLGTAWLLRGRPIKRGSTIYMPVYHETDLVSAVWAHDLVTGHSNLSDPISAPGGLIHPTLVDSGGDEFRCFFRNPRSPNRIHFAYSMDRGATWSKPNSTALPNPNSGIDVAVIADSRLVCAYNDSEKNRYPLSLAVSSNGGVEWTKVGDLERLPEEYSYPSLLSAGGRLYLAYTYKRRAIKFVSLDPERL